MNYVNNLNICGMDIKEIPCIKGTGSPTIETEGTVGLLYMDTESGEVYKCTAVTDDATFGISYKWQCLSNDVYRFGISANWSVHESTGKTIPVSASTVVGDYATVVAQHNLGKYVIAVITGSDAIHLPCKGNFADGLEFSGVYDNTFIITVKYRSDGTVSLTTSEIGGKADLSGVEKIENKMNDFNSSENPTTDYPTVQAVEDYVIGNVKYIVPIITLDDYLANPNKEIYIKTVNNIITGTVVDTASQISTSNLFYCNEGDRIIGKLSGTNGSYAVFATYDKSGNVKYWVKAEGQGDYIDFEHTFTADEHCFRISGVATNARKKNYSLTYIPIDNARADIKELREHIHAPTPVTYNFSDHVVKGIAHGGWKTSSSTPEGGPINTIAAFKLAKQNDFSFVECDTAFTSDGVVVLLHDTIINTTARNTDGSEITKILDENGNPTDDDGNTEITKISFEAVRKLDFGIHKRSEFAGEKIPTFEEFILYCRNAKLFPYIEIKSTLDYPDEILYEMFNTVKRYGMEKSCTWISFEIEQLRKVVSIDPNARVGYLLQDSWTKDLGKKTDTFLPKALKLRTGSNEVFLDVSYSGLMADVTVEETVDGEVVEKVIQAADRIAACKAVNMPIEVWTTSQFSKLDPYVSGATSNGDDYEAYLLEQATT